MHYSFLCAESPDGYSKTRTKQPKKQRRQQLQQQKTINDEWQAKFMAEEKNTHTHTYNHTHKKEKYEKEIMIFFVFITNKYKNSFDDCGSCVPGKCPSVSCSM